MQFLAALVFTLILTVVQAPTARAERAVRPPGPVQNWDTACNSIPQAPQCFYYGGDLGWGVSDIGVAQCQGTIARTDENGEIGFASGEAQCIREWTQKCKTHMDADEVLRELGSTACFDYGLPTNSVGASQQGVDACNQLGTAERVASCLNGLTGSCRWCAHRPQAIDAFPWQILY